MSKVLGYKIRHTKTSLYLSSLSRMKWTKVGKTWPRKGDLIRSVNKGFSYLKKSNWSKSDYDSIAEEIMLWEVVELTEESSYSALFLLDKFKT